MTTNTNTPASHNPVPAVCAMHDRRTVATAPVILVALLALGVTHVHVGYDGEHGKGQVGPIEFFAGPSPSPAVTIDDTLKQQVASLFTALLACLCPRWDLGSGSWGYFSWQLPTRQLTHEYRPRVCARIRFAFPIAVEPVALARTWPG